MITHGQSGASDADFNRLSQRSPPHDFDPRAWHQPQLAQSGQSRSATRHGSNDGRVACGQFGELRGGKHGDDAIENASQNKDISADFSPKVVPQSVAIGPGLAGAWAKPV